MAQLDMEGVYRPYVDQGDFEAKMHEQDDMYNSKYGRKIYQGRQQYPNARENSRDRWRPPTKRNDDRYGNNNPGFRNSQYDSRENSYYADDQQGLHNNQRNNGDAMGTKMIGFTFLVLGFVLLTLAVLEVLFCLEHAYYSRFWTSTVVIFFAIFIFVHGGDYRMAWKNVMVLVYGIIATICIHITVALVMKPLAIEVLKAAEMETSALFESSWLILPFNIGENSIVDISSRTQPWLCLGLDTASIGLLMLLFLTAATTAIMADRFWREIYEYSEEDKFGICSPCLFNPYGQISSAQALSFVGIVCIYSSLSGITQWNDYWIPVWTAGISGLALVMQVAALVASIATIVLTTMGLIDVIKVLDDIGFSVGFVRKHAIATACLLALQDLVALVNCFYTIGLTVKLFDNLYKSSVPMEKTDPSYQERKHNDNRY